MALGAVIRAQRKRLAWKQLVLMDLLGLEVVGDTAGAFVLTPSARTLAERLGRFVVSRAATMAPRISGPR